MYQLRSGALEKGFPKPDLIKIDIEGLKKMRFSTPITFLAKFGRYCLNYIIPSATVSLGISLNDFVMI